MRKIEDFRTKKNGPETRRRAFRMKNGFRHSALCAAGAILAIECAALGAAAAPHDAVADLSGEWRVSGANLRGTVRLPGTLADAKLGRHVTMADWRKDTDRRSKYALTREWQYLGKAVYEREFEIPQSAAAQPLELVLERVMGLSEASIDGRAIGSCDSLGTEHVYAIPADLAAPGKHTIALALDNSNRYNFSGWSHGYGPVMQSVWHGVRGGVWLRRADALRKARVFAQYPANGKLAVETPESFVVSPGCAALRRWRTPDGGAGEEPVKLALVAERPSPYRKGFKIVEFALPREPQPWSENHPALYELELTRPDGFSHAIRFGFRTIEARDRAIWINGNRWFMRATLDNCHFPLTGAPDMSKEWWLDVFSRMKREDGLNSIRFHSWTPPRAAFEAADEAGMLLAVETGIWVDTWHRTADKLGWGKPIDGFAQRELRAVLEAYGNSPSFFSMGIGNELGGSNYKVLSKWMAECKRFDPRRLYIASTARYGENNAPERACTADDYYSAAGVGKRRHRFLPRTDWDYDSVYADIALPVVAHEIGQWPIYPDWENDLAKYTGVLRPYNLQALYERAEKSGTRRFWRRYSHASAMMNRLMYKEEAESYMRTETCSGLQLLGVQDFTGQGEALVGWRDSFYDIKDASRGLPPFAMVMNAQPHLARFAKFIWSPGETYRATLLVRNLGENAIPAGERFPWECAGARGAFAAPREIAPGGLCELGEVAIPLTREMSGKKHLLRFGSNSWPFWVVESKFAPVPEGITVTASYGEMEAALKRGGKVLFTGAAKRCGRSQFKPVYWSAAHFRHANAEMLTLGYSIDANHPALRLFPSEDWSDWQWYHLVEGGRNYALDGLPQNFEPISTPVPDLHFSTFMGNIFELKTGGGRLLVCGCRIDREDVPGAAALRNSLLAYMAGDDFNPRTETTLEWLAERFDLRPPASGPRPARFAEAPVYIEAANGLRTANRNVPWEARFDRAEMTAGSHAVSGGRGSGIWRDAAGAYWHGKTMKIELRGIAPVHGTVWVRFRDPNKLGRTGRCICEGRATSVPLHQDMKDGAWWARMPIAREDALDGKIEITCEAATGPNLMVDRIAIVPDK